VKSAARYLGCEAGAVRKLYERRKVPHYQDGPGCKVYLRRRELDQYLEANRRGRAT
jgi:excisionase family DNA binding protein